MCPASHASGSRLGRPARFVLAFTNSYSDEPPGPERRRSATSQPAGWRSRAVTARTPRHRPGHSRGHRRAAARLPPCPDRPRRGRHHDLLQRGPRRRRRRQQRQAAQGPLLPRQLRHPRRRLRRGVPALPDRPRDRRDPGLARGHRRHRQPRPRARQLLRLPQPRLPRRGAARRRPRRARARSSPASTCAPSTTSSQIVGEHGVAIGVIATPAAAAQDVADRMVAAGITSILNFAPTVLRCPTASTYARSTCPSSCRSSPTTSSARRHGRGDGA